MRWYKKAVEDINSLIRRNAAYQSDPNEGYNVNPIAAYNLLDYMKKHVPENCIDAWIVPEFNGTLNANWETNHVNVDIASHTNGIITYWAVSYTHLTLPTIYSV